MLLNKKIRGNFLALFTLYILNYIFPFFTVPYLSRILSVEHYGLIIFATAFTAYFGIICDYGFGLTAVKDIAINSNDKLRLNRIVSSVTIIKIGLFLLSVIVGTSLIFIIPKFNKYWFIYLVNLLGLTANILFPAWFFQGMEKMKYITVINIMIRILSVILIFLLVHADGDFYLVPIINAGAAILSGLYAQYLLLKIFEIKYLMPSWQEIRQQLAEGWYFFISTVAISLYTVSNVFFLGIIDTTRAVAYYGNAERIMMSIQGAIGPLLQAIFPFLTRVINEDKLQGIQELKKAFRLIGGIGALISIFLLVSAPLLVKMVFGDKYLIATTHTLMILAWIPFLICVSNVFGIQTMLPFGFKKPFSIILIISSITNLILIFLLVPRLSYIGSAISVLITESLVTLMMFCYLYAKGVWVWSGKLIPNKEM